MFGNYSDLLLNGSSEASMKQVIHFLNKGQNPIKLTVLCIGLIVTLVSSNLNFGPKNWTNIIEADAKGYYAYLPAIFIYNDLNYGFFEEIEKKKYYSAGRYFHYRFQYNGRMVNKYYAGTALVQTPFFLMGHLWASISHHDTDGYSRPYLVMINIAAICCLLIGLTLLAKTLMIYQISSWHVALVLAAITFGTNAFYYTVREPGMSHIYSFAVFNFFIFQVLSFVKDAKAIRVLWIAATLGLIVLIRPVNGLVLLAIPFLAGSPTQLTQRIRGLLHTPLTLIGAVFIGLALVGVQLIIYKVSSGHFMVYSYADEGFNWAHPHFIDILFSYKKGLFLYTPLLLISLLGTYFIYGKSKFQAIALLTFFILLTYVLSSWHSWWYGGSFSSRVYLEYLPFFAILLGLALENIQLKWAKSVYISLIFAFVLICQIQTYQYRYHQIHWSEMTREKYWDVFLRIDRINQ